MEVMNETTYRQKYSIDALDISEEIKFELIKVFNQIDDYIKRGNLPKNQRFTLPNTPTYLQQLGADDTEISLPVSVVKKAEKLHNLCPEEIKNAILRMYDPMFVFDKDEGENQKPSLLLITDEFKDLNPLVLSINLNDEIKVKHHTVEVQDVRTIFDKSLTARDGTNLIDYWCKSGFCRYVDDKKISDWNTVSRNLFPIEVFQSDNQNILTKTDVVNNQSKSMNPIISPTANSRSVALINKTQGEKTMEEAKAFERSIEKMKNQKIQNFKQTALYTNSMNFYAAVKDGSIPFLSGEKREMNGVEVIAIKPVSIHNAFSGKILKGADQLVGQYYASKLIKQGEKINGEIATFEECAKEGVLLKKGKGNFKINRRDGKVYQFFFNNSFSEKSVANIAAAKYSMDTKQKIESLRKTIENMEEDDKAKNLAKLAYLHKDMIFGTILRPAANETNKFGFGTFKTNDSKMVKESVFENGMKIEKEKILEPQLPLRIKEVTAYLDTLPKAERNSFEKNIMIKTDENGSFKKLSVENLIEEFNEEFFRQKSVKAQERKETEQKKTGKEIVFDSRKVSEPGIYLSKYLAATQLAKTNPNVIFLTDEASQKSVQKELVKQMERSISENRHIDIFRTATEAGKNSIEELKLFRARQYETELSQNNFQKINKVVSNNIDNSMGY